MNEEAKGEMDPDTPDGADRFLDLSNDLRAAVLWVKQRPVPQAALQRALEGALTLPAAIKSAPAVKAPSDRSRVGKLIPWMMAAAMCLTIATWFFRPADLWAEVLQNTQKQRWIHATIRVPQSDQVQEFWLSTSRGQSASRSKEQILVLDRELGTMDRYEPQKKTLYRFPVTADDLTQQDQLLGLFEGLFRGEVKSGVEFRGTVLKEQNRRQVEEGAKKWDEFELQWRSPPPGGPDVQMIFFVDPQTHLPQSMTGKFGKELVEFTFDYPENGPGDVYALGAPKDAKVVDQVPQDDLARIYAGLKAGYDRFDDYRAMVIVDREKDLSHWKGPMANRVYLVWKKGKKWRVEFGVCRALNTNDLTSAKDKKEWVRDAFKKTVFETMNVCDGHSVYRGEMVNAEQKRDRFEWLGTPNQPSQPWRQATNLMPETSCYPYGFFPDPKRFGGDEYKVTAVEGVPNTILVTRPTSLNGSDSGGSGLLRYWVDSNKGFAMVEHDVLTTDASGKSPGEHDSKYMMEDWRQTPSGVWYPARIGNGWALEGPTRPWAWYHLFLDFNTEMPDSLFRPEKRTVLADHYPVVPLGH